MRVLGRNASVLTALGGAAFAGSIGYCAWTYLVTWRVPHRTAFSAVNLASDVMLFTIFALHHSLTARQAVKARIGQAVGPAAVRTVFVWIASVMLVLVCAMWRPLGGLVYEQTGVRATACVLIQVAGLWFAFEAVRTIDPLELAGFEPKAPVVLQQKGPYRYVRHPLYTGWMLIVFGAATMTADRLAFAITTSTYLLIAIPWEEASLRRGFGEPYLEYEKQVRWRVLPLIY